MYIEVSGIEDYKQLSSLVNLRKVYIRNGDVEEIRKNVRTDVEIREETSGWYD